MSEDRFRSWQPDDEQSGNDQWAEGSTGAQDTGDEGLYESSGAILQDGEVEGDGSRGLGGIPRIVFVIAAAVVALILLVVLVQACRSGGQAAPVATTTPATTIAPALQLTFTPTALVAPITSTLDLTLTVEPAQPTPVATVKPAAKPTANTGGKFVATGKPIKKGVLVRVKGTEGQGLRFRSGAGVNFASITILQDGDILTVVGGPEKADGFNWWHLEASDGSTGWTIARNLQAVARQ